MALKCNVLVKLGPLNELSENIKRWLLYKYMYDIERLEILRILNLF